MKEKYWKYFGSALVVLGLLAIAYPLLPFDSGLQLASAQGSGMLVDAQVKSYPAPLSTAGRGEWAEYKVTIKNTGTVKWDGFWFSHRICTRDSTPVKATGGNAVGEYYVCSCSAGTDDIQCRETIENGWNMQYKTPSFDWRGVTDDKMGDQVFCPNSGTLGFDEALNPGESYTFHMRVKTPTNADGSYPVISTGIADVGGSRVVETDFDTLTVGKIDGTMSFEFVGVILSMAGALALATKGII